MLPLVTSSCVPAAPVVFCLHTSMPTRTPTHAHESLSQAEFTQCSASSYLVVVERVLQPFGPCFKSISPNIYQYAFLLFLLFLAEQFYEHCHRSGRHQTNRCFQLTASVAFAMYLICVTKD